MKIKNRDNSKQYSVYTNTKSERKDQNSSYVSARLSKKANTKVVATVEAERDKQRKKISWQLKFNS